MVDQANANIQQMFNKDILVEPEKAVDTTGEWMSVQDASNATGLSMGTLRRYIKARKLKSRRLGRTINSKLEVLVTRGMLPENEPVDVLDFEGEEPNSDDDLGFDQVDDQPDQSSSKTLAWLQKKLDEKDAELRSKEAKIENLNQQLAGAIFRNGYLEAEKSTIQEKILLLEDKGGAIPLVNNETIERQTSDESSKSAESIDEVLRIKVEALQKELEQLKKPWWKKMFEAPPAESK